MAVFPWVWMVEMELEMETATKTPVRSRPFRFGGGHPGNIHPQGLHGVPMPWVDDARRSGAGIGQCIVLGLGERAFAGHPKFDRVEPGDPTNSYLWLKVSGTSAGERMPLQLFILDNINLTNI